MKNSPDEYADMLIEQHGNVKSSIIDVTNTLDSNPSYEFWRTYDDETPSAVTFFEEVLTILKSKL